MAAFTLVEVGQRSEMATPAVTGAHWQDVAQLAETLLELRASFEGQLRLLTSMQRSLERIRRIDSLAGETDLLLGEMSRHLSRLSDEKNRLADGLLAAGRCLDTVRSAFTGTVLPSEQDLRFPPQM